MAFDEKAKPFQRCLSGAFRASLHFFGAVLVYWILALSPAFGQSTYSDSWLSGTGYADDNANYDDANSVLTSVAGCGVTEGSYSHKYYVDTALTGPNGNTAYGSSGQRVGNARANVTLTWSSNDIGSFLIDSEHFSRCPGDDLNYYSIGSTSVTLPIGASFSCYLKQSAVYDGTKVTALYRVIENCQCTCKSNTATVVFRRGPTYNPKMFLSVVEPYAYTPVYGKVCSHVTTWRDVTECHTCLDIDVP